MSLPAMPTELELVRPSGERVPLCSLWADGPVVVAFVRHFG